MYEINAPLPAQRNFNTPAPPLPQPSMPRDQWTYTVFSAVFAVCIIAVPAVLFAAFQMATNKDAFKNIQEMWGFVVVGCGFFLFWGTVTGMIVALLVEIVGRKRKFNSIVVAALAGALWGGLTSFVALIILILISLLFAPGAALPMIAAIIVAIPFCSIYFALAMTCCRLAAKRRPLKIYHVFFLASLVAIVYSAIAPMLMLLYVAAQGFAK